MMSRYDNDVSMYQATPKQHLKINSCESYTEAVLKRSVSYKKASLVPLTIPPSSWCESLFNLFFCSVVNLKLFFVLKKSVFLVQIFWIPKLQFEDRPFKQIFFKEFTFCSKSHMCQIVNRKCLLFK